MAQGVSAHVVGPDPMALLEVEATTLTSAPCTDALIIGVAASSTVAGACRPTPLDASDAMALLEAGDVAAKPSSPQGPALTAASAAAGPSCETPHIVRERVCLPALSARRAPSSPSPSPEPRPRVKSRRELDRELEVRDLREDGGEVFFSPLERLLLRSGEIMEGYSVKSRALGR